MRKPRKERERISTELRKRVLKRDGYRCRYCGSKVKKYHLDHVYPVIRGGETTEENLVVSCPICNMRKHDKVGIWPNSLYEHGRIVRATKLSESREKRRIASCLSEYETPLWMLILMSVGTVVISAQVFGWVEWRPFYDIGLVLLTIGIYADFSWFLSKYIIFQKLTDKDGIVDIVKLFNRILEWMT